MEPSARLWKKEDRVPTALRIPKMRIMNYQGDSRGQSTIKHNNEPGISVIPPEMSRLSAEAEEFVPSFIQKKIEENTSAPQSSAIQNRLKKHRNEQEPELNFNNEEADINSSDRRLLELISILTTDPGQFDCVLESLLEAVMPYLENIISVGRLTEILVTEAALNSSFSYSAAKLCYHIEQDYPEFRAQLHLSCDKKLKSNLPDKRGLVLFVAELYARLHYENLYGQYLITAFKQMINKGDNESVKCVCQALKLTGHSLELYNRTALDEVIQNLENIKYKITGTASDLLNSVLNLRTIQWGYENETNDSEYPESYENDIWSEGVDVDHAFYNIDGHHLTAEESAFLAANIRNLSISSDYFFDNSNPDELCDPEPEMDEEIQAGFREFLKLSKR